MKRSVRDRALSIVVSDPELCEKVVAIMRAKNISGITRRPMTLTNRMRELYAYIRAYTKANDGVAPSFDEMKEAMGLASKSGIHRLVTALEERGAIRRLTNHARAIVCLDSFEIVSEVA